MNTFIKTVRVVTDLVILAVMSFELSEQINKIRLKKAASHTTHEEVSNDKT